MKRKINYILFCAAFILVILACVLCAIGAANGSFYVQTKGTASGNINQLFASVLSGDGSSCVQYTDTYQEIDFDASGEGEAVSAICRALQQSYALDPVPEDASSAHSLEDDHTVRFTALDLSKMEEDIAPVFENNVFEIVMNSDTNVTTPEGTYLPEIYEQAYAAAVMQVLQNPESYYVSKDLQVHSVYQEIPGRWCTEIDSSMSSMLQGGLSAGIISDTLSVPKAVRAYAANTIDRLKGEPSNHHEVYTLPYSSTVGPKPDASKYVRFSVDQADQVLNIIAYARSCGLLGEQQVIFSPDASFYPEEIICYCDETILVICWKEYINGSVCNCMEVKIADASQMKRKLTGDTYNSGILDTMSHLSVATNAVAAMNGDYYGYRPFGITVYQGQLYRMETSCEVLMIDDQGKFLFYYPDGKTAEELQEYIDRNHIQFSLAFGPVLVDNYTPRYYTPGYVYGLGQMTEQYTRAAFGEFDDLHYLFMTSGYAVNAVPPVHLDAFLDILLTKNLKNVYNLDGGQTAEIVIQNEPYNQIDYRAERQMSDMVFFATALPEEER